MMWEKPDRRKDRSFMCWFNKKPIRPWMSLNEKVITILRKLIHPNPSKRLKIAELRTLIEPFVISEQRLVELNSELDERRCIAGTQHRSQRFEIAYKRLANEDLYSIPYKRRPISSSQPSGCDSCCLVVLPQVCSQTQDADSQNLDSQNNDSQCSKYKLRYKLTRFQTKNISPDKVYRILRKLISINSLTCKMESNKDEMLISSSKVEFKVCLYPMSKSGVQSCLVEFRRTS
ncbi:hypothetical protein GJ496_008948, partial [Pomphorhynchus laevis]